MIDIAPLGIPPLAWLVGSVVLLVLVMVATSAWSRSKQRRSPVSEGLVLGVVGRPGSGKTYMAAKVAYERLRAGATVCTNFSMALPPELAARWVQWSGWQDVGKLQDCIVVLDEAHLIAPSEQGFRLPDVARWWLSQVRRFGCELIWISQNEARVSKTLRDLTNYIWVCNSFRGGKSFKATLYEPEELRKEGRHLQITRYKFDPAIGRIFDSWEILGSVEARDERTARTIGRLAADRNASRPGAGAHGAAGRPALTGRGPEAAERNGNARVLRAGPSKGAGRV